MSENIHVCPFCEQVFTDLEVFEYNKRQAMKILVEHGFPLRTVGKLIGGVHPSTVKYHAQQTAPTKPAEDKNHVSL